MSHIIILFGDDTMMGKYMLKFCHGDIRFHIKKMSDYDIVEGYKEGRLDSDLMAFIPSDVYVVNCIDSSPQSHSANDMFILNAYFPLVLHEVCERVGARFITLGSSDVFDYPTESVCYENSQSNAHTLYGLSKILGEIHQGCILIRTSLIGYEENDSNIIYKLRRNFGKKLMIDNSEYLWNGVTCLELCKFITEIILGKPKVNNGVYHVVSCDNIKVIDLLRIINHYFKYNVDLETDYVLPSKETILYSSKEYTIRKYIEEQIIELEGFEHLKLY